MDYTKWDRPTPMSRMAFRNAKHRPARHFIDSTAKMRILLAQQHVSAYELASRAGIPLQSAEALLMDGHAPLVDTMAALRTLDLEWSALPAECAAR